MKKLKRIITLFLAIMITFTMNSAVFAGTPNTDLKTKATITVTNLPHDVNADNFSAKAYKIFTVDSSETSGVKFADPFTSLTFKDDGLYMSNGTKATAQDFQSLLTEDTTAAIIGQLSDTKDKVKFSDAEAGAYLVILADTENTYNPMIAVTYNNTKGNYAVSTDVSLKAKASGNSLTKEDKDEDKTVSVGDVITYTITTTVPYIPSDATSKTFSITDTLKGASYAFDSNNNGEWKVILGNEDVSGTYKAPSATVQEGTSTFTVELNNMITETNIGKKVTITYNAIVTAEGLAANGNSVSNVANNKNTKAEYITNPKDDKSGSVTIVKTASNGTTPLEGAQFILLNSDGTKVAKVTHDANGYYFAGWEVYSSTTDYVDKADYAISANETNDQNSATVKGLAAGTYQFKEIKAPDGYSINSSNVTETITSSITDGEVTVTSPTGTMKDTKISSLPSTGGRGTLIFTLVGCAVMIYFASSYMKSKKKSEQ